MRYVTHSEDLSIHSSLSNPAFVITVSPEACVYCVFIISSGVCVRTQFTWLLEALRRAWALDTVARFAMTASRSPSYSVRLCPRFCTLATVVVFLNNIIDCQRSWRNMYISTTFLSCYILIFEKHYKNIINNLEYKVVTFCKTYSRILFCAVLQQFQCFKR